MKRSTVDMIGSVISIIGLLVTIWIIASWVNVIAHNTSDYSYASWNLFTMLCR